MEPGVRSRMVCNRYWGFHIVLYPENRRVFVTVQICFVQCRVLLKLTSLSWKYILADKYSVLQLLHFLSPYSENAEIQLFVSQLRPFCTLRSYIPCEYFDITFLSISLSIGLSPL